MTENNRKPAELIKGVLRVREMAMIILLLISGLIMTIFSPYFLSWTNFVAISRGFAMEGLVVVGMSILLVSGAFDLSVGSVMALAGIVAAWLMVKTGTGQVVAVLCGIGVGGLAGLINGLVVSKIKVNPLIATLGMMSVARGICLGFTEGRPVINVPLEFAWYGQGSLAGFPVPFLIMILLVVIADLALRRSRPLRQLYYVGGNQAAARLSGINVDRVVMLGFGQFCSPGRHPVYGSAAKRCSPNHCGLRHRRYEFVRWRRQCNRSPARTGLHGAGFQRHDPFWRVHLLGGRHYRHYPDCGGQHRYAFPSPSSSKLSRQGALRGGGQPEFSDV